jgi:hypothetical protein
MRRILTTALALVLLTALPLIAQQQHHVVSTPDTLKWVDPPTFPGAKLAIIQGDPSKEGLFVYRVRMPGNFKIPPHFHKSGENVTVLAGSFNIGMGEVFDQSKATLMPVGGFVSIPPTHRHFAWAGPEETLIQVHGVGPTDITFVNAADDPRKK